MRVCSVRLIFFGFILKGEAKAPFLAGSAYLRIVLDQVRGVQLNVAQ
ncbi:hypothetical protein TH47_02020 [Thalassospira sp. MCCC 1A02803]|nr:hypothetical protein TH47_02020 [Thalassospira sp. MCCC 1A02803]